MRSVQYLTAIGIPTLRCHGKMRRDTIRTVAFSGDLAPGGDNFSSLRGSPSINASGQVAFLGSVGVAGTGGIWSDGGREPPLGRKERYDRAWNKSSI